MFYKIQRNPCVAEQLLASEEELCIWDNYIGQWGHRTLKWPNLWTKPLMTRMNFEHFTDCKG